MAGASVVLVALAALCWGLSGGIGGMLMAAGWNPFLVSFFRGAIGLLCVLAWLVLRPGGSGLAKPWLWFWAIIAGLGVAGNFAFYFVSIAEGSVAVAATLMYSAPAIVYGVSFAFGLEKPTAFKLAAIALVMAGIVLLTQVYETTPGGITPVGVGAGLLAGLSYAVFIFGFKYAAPHGSPQSVLSIAFTVVALVLIWPGGIDRALAAVDAPDFPLFVILGILGAGLSFVLYVIGLKHAAPTMASMVALVEPITASLFGVLVLNESLAAPQLVGMALILVTVTALGVQSGAERK
ncbi:DMT family transporter [Microbulbifer yueqingensis]|uniref:Threonine/homoserine efflux transporter RhtA n=1 Tax=Microbulbifer yueqingensis TaxID=658219 RepID=A0A1G8V995_9GAMM|nr:DMT family transporter [Microbulbifer yueqingensis]SDJ62427.1 Threonine/homoserine efflux transporter RhtA [Microbulbifer yueqingensis]